MGVNSWRVYRDRDWVLSLNTMMSQSAPSERSFSAGVNASQLLGRGGGGGGRMEGYDEGKDGRI